MPWSSKLFCKTRDTTVERETQRFILVWVSSLLALSYCHAIVRVTSSTKSRLLAFLPVILLFLLLPLGLRTVFLRGPTAFFLSWLATFRLLLLAAGQGPLSPTIPLRRFLLVSCLPIQILQPKPVCISHKKSTFNYSLKSLVFATALPVFQNKERIHPNVLKLCYCVYLYCALELLLAAIAAASRAWLGLELEPQFNEPCRATTLQDFWGRRWNLVVSRTLHTAVYIPVRKIWTRVVGSKYATYAAIIATFGVSGLMHELLFFYIGRKAPSWEQTCFFVMHGVCLAIEVAVKKWNNGRVRVRPAVSGVATVGFVLVTGVWLFMTPAIRSEFDVMVCRELVDVVEFLKGRGVVASES